MSSGGSVTRWIDQARTGDAAAVQKLWERYFPRLVRLASKKLLGPNRRASDEEDVALSVLNSFLRGAAEGRFAQIGDRDNLWAVLIGMTERRVRDQVRHNRRQKRGGGQVRGDSVFAVPAGSEREAGGIEQIIGQEPTPEFVLQMAEECQRLLGLLDDAGLGALAVAKLEGCSNEEAAARLGWALRTVERKLGLIRSIWAEEVTP